VKANEAIARGLGKESLDQNCNKIKPPTPKNKNLSGAILLFFLNAQENCTSIY